MNTPCYTIHLDIFEKNCREVMDAFEEAWGGRVEYGYSVKTNHDAGLMKYAHAKLGWFIETVSPDELELAFNLGFDAENIIFNGPCKCSRQDALINAIRGGAYVNLDNLDDVSFVCGHVSDIRDVSRIGIRVNFNNGWRECKPFWNRCGEQRLCEGCGHAPQCGYRACRTSYAYKHKEPQCSCIYFTCTQGCAAC